MDEREVPLHPAVAQVARAVHADDAGQFSIDAADMVVLGTALLDVRAADRKTVATHLVALALKHEQLAKQYTATVVAQIAVLLGLVLGGIDAAEQSLQEAGVRVSGDVLRVIGAVEAKLPVGGTQRPAGALSPLGLRLQQMKKKPEGDDA